ncbi:diphosphomevalonate decarboxylase [Weizmannia acidilactici]|uniref:diphosphomevalonate decarboxylase n=1 Tax=Weizmannia acidilactici TaxID=2607726 RepID=A0A5J4JIY0_9BACI|nr:diphosphomevalonate decarboxylase [Weizmannia acidilactici]GER66655.1 diphosphomevalonate decarboxylase [Weizmannia acidilactici]GER70655.1 diphosphomevalonate decarboxylase [Weizmannia acidilactici]GER72815.1 diphosphomevalonate decarboxylase [Weizmannia acidilactici]
MEATARAHTNIALIKYWGKRDEKLFLPMNSSLSITLDKFYTTTKVVFDPALKADRFFLNGKPAGAAETAKISRFMDKIRDFAGAKWYAVIESENEVPTAAGLASSASGMAALAAAAVKALGLQVDGRTLSKLARQGSGSACRSIYGGFVEWQKGEKADGSDSYAVPLLGRDDWELSILSCLLESKQKKISSREGMKRTVETSPFYAGWLETVEKDLAAAKSAIARRDFALLGRILEANALKMHATTLGADPPFLYWQSATLDVMREVELLRERGIEAYFTIDAGPNVKVLCGRKDEEAVRETLAAIPGVQRVFICHPGPGVSYGPY